jgi:hypothetical protein
MPGCPLTPMVTEMLLTLLVLLMFLRCGSVNFSDGLQRIRETCGTWYRDIHYASTLMYVIYVFFSSSFIEHSPLPNEPPTASQTTEI